MTGMVRPGPDAPDDRVFTNCWTRVAGGTLRSSAFASTVCVASSTRGATKVIGLVAIDLAVGVEDLHRQAEPQLGRAIERHLDVRLEPGSCRRSW